MPKYSLIIPVYNRPQEIDELLSSLTEVSFNDFEVVIVEDGSTLSSDLICKGYRNKLNITYHYQKNTGPGLARNTGASLAKGDVFIFFDSDCLIPSDYFEAVEQQIDKIDCFGGPDMAHQSFSPIQKAISYSMTSTLTTGGIRGGKKKLDKFYPRSFNMGIKRNVFEALKGFRDIRFGEDLDFSLRIVEGGYKAVLIEDAGVFHKRRNNMKSFFKQVFNSGIARINLNIWHPGSLKLVHAAPSIFTLGYIIWGIISIFIPQLSILLLLPLLIFFIDALVKNKNIKIASLAVVASMVQTFGYGTGFIYALFKLIVLNKTDTGAFNKTFYN
ncbi:glycosyltransferase [Saccharicrinis aurantiacus]|uniref:glycosyltransferase n=1 Tax=Saccharicrinis aurantiacus TaxID=1849719 RepID=UPI0008389226|nr:glycosyltransferase [Saccharicrinis aurantiacus]